MILLITFSFYLGLFLFIVLHLSRATRRIVGIAALLSFVVSYFFIGFIIESVFGDNSSPILDRKIDISGNIILWIWIIAGILIFINKHKTVFSNYIGNSVPSDKISDSLTLSGKPNLMGTPKMNTVIFLFAKTSPIKIISPDFASIAHSIIQEFGRNQFAPSELQNHFLYIKNQYPKLVNQEEYRQILDICNRFVAEGGRLELTLS